MTNSSAKWHMTGDGHLLPSTAGAVDIGSTSAEIGNVYLANNKKIHFGDSQELSMHYTSAGGGASYISLSLIHISEPTRPY